MKRPAAPWYADGLRFACTRCGHCCTGEGYVWVSEARIEAIAEHLGLSRDEFGRRFLRRVDSRLGLVEKANTDCVFWQAEQGCTIYPVRPEQCRSFPFWPENLESPASWQEIGAGCPGVGRGRLHSRDEIERQTRRTEHRRRRGRR